MKGVIGHTGVRWAIFEEIAEDFRKRYAFSRKEPPGHPADGDKRRDGCMCANCGFPAAQGHWTEAGAGSAFDRIRGRLHRARILAPVLASYGLAVHDDGSGSGFILANRTGHQVMVNTLSELWEAAERIIGRPVDPLDSRFAGEAPTP